MKDVFSPRWGLLLRDWLREHPKPTRIVSVILLLVGSLYTFCFNRVELNEIALTWNWATGEKGIQNPGWHVTSPTLLATSVDTRPMRVCVTSASHAAFNCRLIQFDPKGWQELLAVEGWRYYWFANRISFNWGYREEYRGVRDILRGYAFSAKKYNFIQIIRDYDE